MIPVIVNAFGRVRVVILLRHGVVQGRDLEFEAFGERNKN